LAQQIVNLPRQRTYRASYGKVFIRATAKPQLKHKTKNQEPRTKSPFLSRFFLAVVRQPLADHTRFAACNLKANRRFAGKLFHQFRQPV
jgi:hypothetical protein